MKYFGACNDSLDLVPKSYVDVSFDSNANITSLNPAYRDHLVTLDRSTSSLGFSSLPTAGQSFTVYVVASVDGAHLQLPPTVNSRIAIIDGLYPDTTNEIILRITKDEKEEAVTLMTGVVIHVFFDGNIFFLSRHYFDTNDSGRLPVNNSSEEES